MKLTIILEQQLFIENSLVYTLWEQMLSGVPTLAFTNYWSSQFSVVNEVIFLIMFFNILNLYIVYCLCILLHYFIKGSDF